MIKYYNNVPIGGKDTSMPNICKKSFMSKKSWKESSRKSWKERKNKKYQSELIKKFFGSLFSEEKKLEKKNYEKNAKLTNNKEDEEELDTLLPT